MLAHHWRQGVSRQCPFRASIEFTLSQYNVPEAPVIVSRLEKSFTDRQWRNLLTDIHDGEVIVVVGPELAVGGDDPDQTTLYDRLARELVRRLSLKEDLLPRAYRLLDVSNLYLQNPENEADDLFREVRDIWNDLRWPVPKALRRLAEIRGLNLFITTTFDSLLADALNETRFGGAKRTAVLSYSEKAQMQDLPVEWDASPRPTVFHLLGKFNASGDYALTEEKILEYIYRLQSRDLRPPNLFDLLKSKKLLLLGCSLPGWLARFALRASKGDLLLTQGAKGSVVADRTLCPDEEYSMFLERRKMWPYREGDAIQFVEELHRRWQGQFGSAIPLEAALPEQPEAFRPYSVFLSYASEDRPVALQVVQALDGAGVDVWFDKLQLESGDSFRLVIEKNIEHCSYFVPLASRHTTRMDKRFFQREWKKAIDEAVEWPEGYPFIQPLLIDDVELTAPGIPETFRKYHARRLEDLPAFIADAQKRIREMRLSRRTG